MAIAVPDMVLPFANVLRELLCDTLTAVEAPVVKCCIMFGDPPPAQDCCADSSTPTKTGHAWVRVGDTFPVGTFPAPLEGVARCDKLDMSQGYTLGIRRCAPVLGEDGSAPSCEAMAAAALRQTQDAAILRRVIRCALKAAGRGFLLGAGQPLEPRGGCMGWSQQVRVHLEDCPCDTPLPVA